MRKLYRSRTNLVVAGVCSGLAEYLEIDPILVRLAFVLLTLVTGMGLVAYILLWILTPYKDEGTMASTETVKSGAEEIAERAREIGGTLRGTGAARSRMGLLIGTVLIVLGGAFLLRNLDIAWLRWLSFETLWPLLLIGIGGVLIWRRLKGE